ncbi:TMEM175 family protein [Streptomyces otsuchiensis]|uniref:TMEM175 family protein n=1 Tax=Streptomyces otsuchiensis TaxID=2681388 RepID=UPI001031A3F1|nr:TMEM175 family protein [Streptomyces otsuchiensis]
MSPDPRPQPAPAPDRDGAPAPGADQEAGRFRRADTARVEAFSDAVFAIAVTILVLGISDPAHSEGGLARALLEQWPAYLGYVASFGYIAVIWLNHHQAFARVRRVDRGLHAANLALLGVTAALAFPTGVVSDALQEDPTGRDARTAVALYALVAALMCCCWLALYGQLRRRPQLLERGVDPAYVRHGRLRSAIGVAAYAAAGVVGYAVTPVAGLAVFVVVPAFYFLTSEGFRHAAPASRPAGRD